MIGQRAEAALANTSGEPREGERYALGPGDVLQSGEGAAQLPRRERPTSSRMRCSRFRQRRNRALETTKPTKFALVRPQRHA